MQKQANPNHACKKEKIVVIRSAMPYITCFGKRVTFLPKMAEVFPLEKVENSLKYRIFPHRKSDRTRPTNL